MHDGMPYDLIQGQGQGHGASEVLKIALFKVYLLRHLQRELENDHRKIHRFLKYGSISKIERAGFVIFVLVLVSCDFELGGKLCAL